MAFNQKTLGNNLIKIGDKEIATSQKLDDASRNFPKPQAIARTSEPGPSTTGRTPRKSAPAK